MDKPIKFTEKAIAEIKKRLKAKGVPLNEIYVRIGIASVTCRGFSYLLDWTDKKAQNDCELEIDGIHVLIDERFCPMFEYAEVDYVVAEDLQNTGFKIKNPNERPICGCGASHDPCGEKS